MSTKNALADTIYGVLHDDAPHVNEARHRALADEIAKTVKGEYTPPVPKFATPKLVEAAWNAVTRGNTWDHIGCFYRDDMRHAINTVLTMLHDRIAASDPEPVAETKPTAPTATPGLPREATVKGEWETTTLVKLIESALHRAPSGVTTEHLARLIAQTLVERMNHPLVDGSQPVDVLMLICRNLVRIGLDGECTLRGSRQEHLDFHHLTSMRREDEAARYAQAVHDELVYDGRPNYTPPPKYGTTPIEDAMRAPTGWGRAWCDSFKTVDENDARLRDASIAFKALDKEAALGTLNENLVDLKRALGDLAAEIKASVMPRHAPKSSLLADVAPMLYDPTCPPATEDEPPRVTATSPFQLYATGVDRCDWCKRGGYNRCNHRLVGVRRG